MRLMLPGAAGAAAIFFSFSGCGLRGQSAPAPAVDPDAVMTRLYALAADYGAKLPSLSCHESIWIFDMKHGEIKRTTKIESTIRVVRTGKPNSPFTETHSFLTKDGLPAPEKFRLTYWVTGAFANGLGFLRPETRGCYDDTVSPGEHGAGIRVEVAEKPHAEWMPVCRDISLPGYRKTVLLDDAGHVFHLDRSIPADVAREHKEVSFAEMDYAPVKLGEETLWLPSRMASHDPQDEHRLEVSYSACQRFTGSVKILDGVTPLQQ